jgi:hypothetical protein
MLIDSVFTIIIFLIQNYLIPLLPESYDVLSFTDYEASLNGSAGLITKSFSGISNVFPVELLLAFIIVFILAELALLGVKSIFWLINVFRGSGA